MMRGMKRVLSGVVCVLAFAAATTVASAATAKPSCSHCGYVWAKGTGTVIEDSASGASVASIKTGSIAVRGGNTTVSGASSHHWDSNLKATVYKGNTMCLKASGDFWVKITGTVSNFSSTARASVTLNGSGDYTVNNGPKKKWSSSSHPLSIRW